MEKRMKYDFEFKLKFLNFLNLAWVMSPPTLSLKWKLGGHDPMVYGIQKYNFMS